MKLGKLRTEAGSKLVIWLEERPLVVAALAREAAAHGVIAPSEAQALAETTRLAELCNLESPLAASLRSVAEFAERAFESARLAELCSIKGDYAFEPVIEPDRQFFLLAGNYAEHVKEGEKLLALKAAAQQKYFRPRVFCKFPRNTAVGHLEPIILPENANQPDYEAEMLVIIGKRARFVSEGEALDYVFGYSIINDVSERAFRSGAEQSEEPFDKFFDWLNGKWADTYAPCGPWIVTKDEVPDPHDLELRLEIDGETRQRANTGEMVYNIAQVVAFISTITTLESGDAIATGTPSGVGSASGRFLQAGQQVSLTLEKVGTLTNLVQTSSK